MKKSEECRRDYSVTVPPPTVNLYPIIEQHPNEITRGNNLQSQPLPPVYSQSTGNINEPPPYNEQQQHHISCPIGVRYFVHGQQEGGRCSINNNDGREFHAIHTNIPNNGDTVFYYISTSPSNPGCKRSEPFLLIRRRRTSIASIALSLFIISIILIVFVRMHTEFTRKYQEGFKQQQQLYGTNNYGSNIEPYEGSSNNIKHNNHQLPLYLNSNYFNNNTLFNSTNFLTNSSSILIENNNHLITTTTTTIQSILFNFSNTTNNLDEDISLNNETLISQTMQNEPPQEQQI